MAYELAEQMDWRWPDWIVYPTGGGTGMVGMWKAFDEIERIGWVSRGRRPRMVSVQAEDCAPIVRAFEQGTEKARAVGRRVDDRRRPARAARDRRFSDPARGARERRHGGRRLRPRDGRRDARDREAEGVSAAPEGGAALAAISVCVADGAIKADESSCSSTPAAR